jgi:hypothetical protein
MAADHNSYFCKNHFNNYIIITGIIEIHVQLSAFTAIKVFKICWCSILGYDVVVSDMRRSVFQGTSLTSCLPRRRRSGFLTKFDNQLTSCKVSTQNTATNNCVSLSSGQFEIPDKIEIKLGLS